MQLFRNPWFWWGAGIGLAGILGGLMVWAAYRLAWFPDKTPWDWLSLLVIPLALALVALGFNFLNARTERKIAQQRYDQDRELAEKRYKQDQDIAQHRYEQDQQIALDKQREDLLQAYFDRMSELLLEKGLRSSPTEEIRNVARVRTITVLAQLDARRIGYVFTFLREAELMSAASPTSVVSLKDADLRAVNWKQARLRRASLSGANLRRADLSGASLWGADLSRANLSKTNLIKASLIKADLSRADLSEADLSGAYLSEADLSGANLKGAKIDKSQLTPEQIAQAIWDEETLEDS